MILPLESILPGLRARTAKECKVPLLWLSQPDARKRNNRCLEISPLGERGTHS